MKKSIWNNSNLVLPKHNRQVLVYFPSSDIMSQDHYDMVEQSWGRSYDKGIRDYLEHFGMDSYGIVL